jgi:hypothetical protein
MVPELDTSLATETDSNVVQIREIILRTRDMVDHVRSLADAIMLVRRSGAAEKLMQEALKTCHLLEQEQFELKQEAAETHLRTQRRSGEFLITLAKHRGGRPPASSPVAGTSDRRRTLRELGITWQESHRWQRIARIPSERFDSFVSTSRQRRKELTVASAIALSKRVLSGTDNERGPEPAAPPRHALSAEYDTIKVHLSSAIWLDPIALASTMSSGQRREVLVELDRWQSWICEFADELKRTV